MAGVSKAALTVFVGKKRPFESLKRVCSAFNCRRNAQWMFGTFYSENNWRGGRKKNVTTEAKKINTRMNAQGRVIVSLLSGRLIAEESWVCFFSALSSWDLVYTKKIWKTASENILMAHACEAHTGQIDGMPQLLNALLMDCQGFSHVAQFTSWEICICQ